jgi:hypothetical protein
VKIQLTQKQLEAIIMGKSVVVKTAPGATLADSIELAIDPRDLYFQADAALGPVGIDAQHDPELAPWLLGISNGDPVPSGIFLHFVAHAALTADSENYRILRPVIVLLKKKYPKYGAPAGGAR